jgi:chaperone modulatory protein CbpM
MLDATELCREVGIQRTALDTWIEAGWVRPRRALNDWRFSTIDLLRAQFIVDLRGPMGVNDEGVAVILNLLDQIYGLRRALQGVTSAMDVHKTSSRVRQAEDAGSSIQNPPSGRAPRPARSRHAAV